MEFEMLDMNMPTLDAEVDFWRTFEANRRRAGLDRFWLAPIPHVRFGYGAFFRVRWSTVNGVRMRSLVARINLNAMLVFAVPQEVWRGAHDADVPPAYHFNPLWYANERSCGGLYNLYLFEQRGVRYVMTTMRVRMGFPLYLYYGDIDNRSWRCHHPTPRQQRLDASMLEVPTAWPSAATLRAIRARVEAGFAAAHEVIE
jgi:hypothetical protein